MPYRRSKIMKNRQPGKSFEYRSQSSGDRSQHTMCSDPGSSPLCAMSSDSGSNSQDAMSCCSDGSPQRARHFGGGSPRRRRRALVLGLCAALFLLPGCSACSTDTEEASADADTSAETETQSQSQAVSNTVEWNGKTYTYNTSLTNILFLGIDKSDDISNEDYIPGAAGQSDCIMILSLNEETEEATILQINRNTMTSIDIYDAAGNYSESIIGQLCLQYAYDIGGKSSCWATKKTVGELLYGVDIDGYFALDVSGVPEINDSLGGVEVTCSYDYTDLDESYTAGTTVLLEGTAAQKFVQYRDITVFNSVQERMYRQVDYVTALIATLSGRSGSAVYDLISPYLDTYILTDMTADEMNALKNYTYLTDDVLYLPGETVMGEEYEEFYVDEEELQDLIIQTFYVEVTDEEEEGEEDAEETVVSDEVTGDVELE